ncbi:MAG: S16 family serine protease [Candidatus Woesearchaeota archaeon]
MKKVLKELLIMLVFLLPVVIAEDEPARLILLAVSESEDGYVGNTAELFLEIGPGTGHVYVDTFPLTKVDTQMSIRFAKEIACDFLEKDCTNKDFFYTVRSQSAIVGGPSAGAASAILTIAALEGIKLNQSVSVTGTINSGGLVGPVGGLRAKIDAASDAGLTKVLIPKGEKIVFDGCKDCGDMVNITRLDIYDYAEQKGIAIAEVSTIDDVFFEFTGLHARSINKSIEISEDYTKTMQDIAQELCRRTKDIEAKVRPSESAVYNEAKNLSMKGVEAYRAGAFYSAASYCFGANIKYNFLYLEAKHMPNDEIKKHLLNLQKQVTNFSELVENRELLTMTDLQTYMIVKERLIDAEDSLKDGFSNLEMNNRKEAIYDLAYAHERFQSALSWSSFFKNTGTTFVFDTESIKEGCIQKISEAEERYQYAQLFFPKPRNQTKTEIMRAYEDLAGGNYALCLFKASKAKAESDLLLSVITIEEDPKAYLNQKLTQAERVIAIQQEKNAFPILGYSYYEYSKSLSEDDISSSLIYAEYALELSNLDIYFRRSEHKINSLIYNNLESIKLGVMFSLGVCFGVLLSMLRKN